MVKVKWDKFWGTDGNGKMGQIFRGGGSSKLEFPIRLTNIVFVPTKLSRIPFRYVPTKLRRIPFCDDPTKLSHFLFLQKTKLIITLTLFILLLHSMFSPTFPLLFYFILI